jgi:GMP synthase-like glutamine amidotransferase
VTGERPLLLVVQHDDEGGLGRFAAPLAEHLDVDVRRPHHGEPLPERLDGFDGLLVLGGVMAAWEDERAPWLPGTRALLREGVQRALPTLGICLGAQLLALATGGRAERGAQGLEVGVVPFTPTSDAASDPLFAPLVAPLVGPPAAVQWHQDAVTALPPGAVLLATGETYPHQAYRVGAAAWGLQYHPEVTYDDVRAWMTGDEASVRATGQDPDGVLARVRAAEEPLAALADAHARAFAAQVAGARAARAAGVTVTG